MKNVNGLVSILIVTYNAERFISPTLKSCLNQTYKNIEILILDNASSDKTLKILKRFNDKRVKIFRKEKNIGAYSGLNFLLDRAKGEFVAIQDHDDLWLPKKIEKQVKFLNKNQFAVACGTETFYFYEKRGVFLLDKCRGFTDFVNHTSLVFRNAGYRYNTNYVLTDEHFEKKILRKEGPIFCIGKPLTIHRIRDDGNNLSHRRFALNRKNLKDFFEINGLSLKAIIYIGSILLVKYFPEKLVWLIIIFAKRRSQKMSKKEFCLRYPETDL